MNKVAKYKLELTKKDEKYSNYNIVGLKKAYYKSGDKLESFGGSCGLLKNGNYKGYSYLCMTYHKMESDELPEPGYIVEFSPLYNENDEMILIEYNGDEVFTVIDRGGYKESWDSDKIVDATLTFWNNGAFTEFDEK